ncbi:MAG TPA: hypothetical protein VFL93_08150 [Longimicrobiaceae bacterium]|nr:hypothetical protein [Longimicrobiaceae bacterium]
MKRRLAGFAGVLALACTVACATAAPRSSGSDSDRVITAAQLAGTRFENLYDAIQSLHSNWFRARGVGELPPQNGAPTPAPAGPRVPHDQVQVYMGNQRLGGIENLRSIPVRMVRMVRFYSATEAGARYGFGSGGNPVIEVVVSAE